MPLILGAQSAVATGFSIDNSCRFNRGDSADLQLTWGTPTLGTKYTFSFWLKRCQAGTIDWIMSTPGDWSSLWFTATDEFQWAEYTGGYKYNLKTNRKFRDPSAWYHFCCRYDSTLGAAGDRQRLYINGVEETSFATDTNPALDHSSVLNSAVLHALASQQGEGAANYADEYLSEVVFIDGSSLAPTSFGEFDEDSPTIWKPIDVSGLTFGNNGFYLDFEDSANLGDDVSGEANNWTEANLTASDQGVDSPTNNFSTGNPLANYYAGGTYTQGNCKWVSGGGGSTLYNVSNVGVTAGKWYVEVKMTTSATAMIGITDKEQPDSSEAMTQSNYAAAYKSNDGKYIVNAGSATTYGDSYTTDDIVGIYIDLDNNKLYFGKNGTVQNSGTGITITGISAMTSPAAGSQGCYFIGGTKDNGGSTFEYNFGGCSAFDVASANQDANGYGNFEYSPSDGGSASFDGSAKDFLAICTKNLGSDGG